MCFNIKAASQYDRSVDWVVYLDMPWKKRSLFWNWWAMFRTWQHALEEWYRALGQMQARWALYHGLAILGSAGSFVSP